ncbi:MAG: peptidoglycan-binding domain-containing protein [Gemmatimonadota bacterium]|nr:peptidoglycan-binding domain-containing protein [Gemmatimonadota bacterium]
MFSHNRLGSSIARRLLATTAVALVLVGSPAPPANAQEVEIISGTTATFVDARPAGAGIRVTAYASLAPERVEHRVASPLSAREILAVQEALAAAGEDPGVRDGRLLDPTVIALNRFQVDAGIEVCGCVSYETVLALGLTPLVVQTVIGPADEPDVEIIVGTPRLPASRDASDSVVETPPDTVFVVQQDDDSWWGFPGYFAPFRHRSRLGATPPTRGGFPIGSSGRLGATRVVPPPP